MRASLNLPRVDLDAWERVLTRAGGPARPSAGVPDAPSQSYLPTTMAVRAQALIAGGRTLNHVVLGGSRDGSLWRANLDAEELSGYVEYRQPGAGGAAGGAQGRVFARLSRLRLAQSAQNDVWAVSRWRR